MGLKFWQGEQRWRISSQNQSPHKMEKEEKEKNKKCDKEKRKKLEN
jgi:hypothetical protein